MSRRTRSRDPKELLEAARDADRGALARLISFVEEGGDLTRQVGRLTFPLAGDAYTIGITGPTGSGKSTLTERLISTVRGTGDEVGVLAVDPSSPFSGGAFLGDRVRMQSHATDEGVFIRSMATRGHLGGLALATPEAIRVLDAAGIPWVLVETVGVGQVEIEIASSADTTVVVEGMMLAKPADEDEAREMLKRLRGKWHEVLTGVALVRTGREANTLVSHQTTRVRFAEMTDAEIDWYVKTGEPMDKAGAYAIQGSAALFIEEVAGEYFNIVGLPVSLVYKLISNFKS